MYLLFYDFSIGVLRVVKFFYFLIFYVIKLFLNEIMIKSIVSYICPSIIASSADKE
jgi:hypothetical protein